MDRSDALMLKENDLSAMSEEGEDGPRIIKRVVSSLDMNENAGFTVIEVRDIEQSLAAATAWDSVQSARGGDERLVLLLDNMGAVGAEEVHRALTEAGLRRRCILEGSGGVAVSYTHLTLPTT